MKRYRVVGFDAETRCGEFRSDEAGAWVLADEALARETELLSALKTIHALAPSGSMTRAAAASAIAKATKE